MKATLTVICFLIAHAAYSTTDIYATQSWELIKDHNANGWADEGDIIRNNIEVTIYCKETQSIDVVNHLKGAQLSIVPGSITIENGTVIKGNNPKDDLIEIQGIEVAEPWGITTVSFDSKIMNTTDLEGAEIKNHSTVIHSSGSYQTNDVIIPILSKVTVVSNDSPFVFGTIFRLMIILGLGIAIGVISKRISIPHLSLD